MGLGSLVSEPARLEAASKAANEELEALVMDNYRVFIENLTCSVELRVEDAKLNKVFDNLGGNLEELSGQCASFREKVSSFIGSHQRNRKTLQHHMQLVELLEVPQLVDACARNGFHDEALELANFVNGLERRHLLAAGLKGYQKEAMQGNSVNEIRRGSVVIQSIVNDVHAALLSLRGQLIGQLSEDSSLPKELQVLAILRKLDSLLVDRQLSLERYNNPVVEALSDGQRERLRSYFLRMGETRLQMEFLEARNMWLQRVKEAGVASSLLKNVSGDNLADTDKSGAGAASSSSSLGKGRSRGPYTQAIELLDVHRSAWFSIVTEYTALFDGQQHGGGSDDAKKAYNSEEVTTEGGGGLFGLGAPANAKSEDIGVVAASISKGEGGEHHRTDKGITAATVLTAWLSTQLQSLTAQLESLCLAIDDGNEFRGIIEQTANFAERMGHVGFDFTSALLPIFHSVVLSKVAVAWSQAYADFQVMLATERYQPDKRMMNSVSLSGTEKAMMQQVVPLYVQQNPLQQQQQQQQQQGEAHVQSTPPHKTLAGLPLRGGGEGGGGDGDGEVPAPRDLSRYPPLAFLLNAILYQLIFLRECPLMTVQSEIGRLLKQLLVRASEHLVKVTANIAEKGARYLEKVSHGQGQEAEGGMGQLYAKAFAFDLAPHALACLDCIFGEGPNRALELQGDRVVDSGERRGSTGAGGVSVGGERISSSINAKKEGKSKKFAALHIERLLDGENALSREQYATLQDVWAGMSSEGLIVEKAHTPSPLPSKR